MIEIRWYATADGRDVVGDWLEGLKDTRARARILTRLDRLAAGNFGDRRQLREGVSELRIDYGPGYRLYYSCLGSVCVLLLAGGDKRSQAADIARAVQHLQEYKRRSVT